MLEIIGFFLCRNIYRCVQRYIYEDLHCSFICKSEHLEMTKYNTIQNKDMNTKRQIK